MNAKIEKGYLFICYCISAIFIINCESVWTSITTTMDIINTLSWRLIVIFCLLGIILKKEKGNVSEAILHIIVITIYLFIYILFCGFQDGTSMMIKLIVVICCLLSFYYLCCTNESIPLILVSYSNIIVAIGSISLFFWIFGSIFGIIHPSGIQYSIWNGSGNPLPINSYWNIYYETQFIKNISLVRNSAVFAEAPVAAVNFLIAYMVQFLYLIGDVRKVGISCKVKCVILALCILSTYSASGTIILVITGVILIFKQNYYSKLLSFLKFVILPLIAMVAVIFIIKILSKKMGNDITQNSGLIRLDDYSAGIKAWLHHPIFGAGIGNSYYVSQYMSLWRNFNLGLSSSFLQIISEGGAYILFIYMYCISKGMFTSYVSKNTSKFLFVLIILVLLFVSIFSYSYLLIFILIWMSSKYFALAVKGEN